MFEPTEAIAISSVDPSSELAPYAEKVGFLSRGSKPQRAVAVEELLRRPSPRVERVQSVRLFDFPSRQGFHLRFPGDCLQNRSRLGDGSRVLVVRNDLRVSVAVSGRKDISAGVVARVFVMMIEGDVKRKGHRVRRRHCPQGEDQRSPKSR